MFRITAVRNYKLAVEQHVVQCRSLGFFFAINSTAIIPCLPVQKKRPREGALVELGSNMLSTLGGSNPAITPLVREPRSIHLGRGFSQHRRLCGSQYPEHRRAADAALRSLKVLHPLP
jgi:hypothetical protein